MAATPLANWLAGCREVVILRPFREPQAAGIRSAHEACGHPKRRLEKLENMASRLDKRKEFEAAEALEGEGKAEKDGKRKRAVATGVKKKAVKKKPRSKPVERRRIVWVIYNNTQKEEDRFPFDQKKAADERIEILRSKSKRLYWLQAVKEVIGAPPPGSATDIYQETYVPEVEEEVEIEVELVEESEEEEEEEEEEEDDDDE